MKHFFSADIAAWEQRYRSTFINSLSGFKALCLVGSVNKNQVYNVAPFNSLVHLGAHPPLMGLIFRPDSTERHTLDNIRSNGVYTINLVHRQISAQAHQCSARYPKQVSEFSATGLNPEFLFDCKAPFVKESKIKWAMQLETEMEIAANRTLFVIGRVLQVHVMEACVQADGYVNLQMAETLTVNGLDAYHTCNLPLRYNYAKPDRELKPLS
jgi:flavin reductase (DIM6/NTAB) family NADH-FMN oxidoreductase RutF